MNDFAGQPDEGYSEDPLNAFGAPATFSSKLSSLSLPVRNARDGAEMSALTAHLSGLSITDRTELVMALLDDLPTTVIAQIVEQLNPRLYIDFVRYLPPEVCLKILGYLDPVSLISVARSCRVWYELALDRKLWERLYYLEGWKANLAEVEAWEKTVNLDSLPSAVQRVQEEDDDDGPARKRRAISITPEGDRDLVMVDADKALKQEPAEMDSSETSIFGGASRSKSTGVTQRMDDLAVRGSSGSGSSLRNKRPDKGKGRAMSPEPETTPLAQITHGNGLPKSTLGIWDARDRRFKINWKYLYTMRRRLESNWELGRYVNFQFPHPDFPEEGHGECIYSLQYNSNYLVSGSRDRTLKVWDMKTRRLIRTLQKHRGSVLCLQFDSDPDDDIIVSGSSDSDVIIWQFSTGRDIQILSRAHRESVLNVKFDKRILVTCSKDKTIKIFNRRPLRYGDLGYQDVDPVPRTVTDYGYNLLVSPEDFPIMPAWTMIGSLEGHNAAVNAVQIYGREVVSASGDRHIKVWDWPSQVCNRTIVGHNKGIACVQYDGRRIVSGSSDNEVKVFDRQTGLEVASLRAHSDLVRTVQSGFGDLPHSAEDDAAEAKKIDAEYFKALESGRLESEADRPRRRQGNAGSKRPEDITAYGAKLPPGGGGGKYGRIVSGSYDTSIIIWRRDKEGVWKDQHHLKQEDAALAAMQRGRAPPPGVIPLHPTMRHGLNLNPLANNPAALSFLAAAAGSQSTNATTAAAAAAAANGPPTAATAAPPGRTASPAATASSRAQSTSAPPTAGRTATPPASSSNAGRGPITQVEFPIYATLTPASIQMYRQLIESAVPAGANALASVLASYPPILTQRSQLTATIDREPNPIVRSQLRQVVGAALIRTQFEQARQRREAIRHLENATRLLGHGAGAGGENGGQGPSNINTGVPAQLPTQTHAVPIVHPAADVIATVSAHVAGLASAASAAGSHPAAVAAATAAATAGISNATAATATPAATTATAHHHVRAQHLGVHLHQLQFDARRIICCSQTTVIIGWDFCNDDPELEDASRFFGVVQ